MPWVYVNSSDNFCYICGGFTMSLQKHILTTRTRKAYNYYFGCKVGDQDKPWAPHVCCSSCSDLERINGSCKPRVSKVWPAELFLKNIYTHFEPQLDRIMLKIPQF